MANTTQHSFFIASCEHGFILMMPESKRWVFWLEREAMNYLFLTWHYVLLLCNIVDRGWKNLKFLLFVVWMLFCYLLFMRIFSEVALSQNKCMSSSCVKIHVKLVERRNISKDSTFPKTTTIFFKKKACLEKWGKWEWQSLSWDYKL